MGGHLKMGYEVLWHITFSNSYVAVRAGDTAKEEVL